jgi:hypothetical protein
MIIHTASEGISAARRLEDGSAAFYESAAGACPRIGEKLLAMAAENRKTIKQIEQVYYGVITDAIEGCFALNLETDDYAIDITHHPDQGQKELIKQIIRIEERVQQFYLAAGEQSKSLMADVSRSFMLTARKRKNRLAQLVEMINT